MDTEVIEKMLNDFQQEKPVTIRCCLNQGTPEELKERLEAEGVTVVPHSVSALCISDIGI